MYLSLNNKHVSSPLIFLKEGAKGGIIQEDEKAEIKMTSDKKDQSSLSLSVIAKTMVE